LTPPRPNPIWIAFGVTSLYWVHTTFFLLVKVFIIRMSWMVRIKCGSGMDNGLLLLTDFSAGPDIAYFWWISSYQNPVVCLVWTNK
jgi:hypothetical protein